MDLMTQSLLFGSVYALIALSLNVSYQPTKVLNFAHGDFVVLGAIFAIVLIEDARFPWLFGGLVACLVVGVIAVIEERLVVRPAITKWPDSHIWVVTTLAFSMILVAFINAFWPPDPRILAKPPLLAGKLSVGGGINVYTVLVIVLTPTVVLIVDRLYRLRSGRAILAVAENRDAALLRGIDPNVLSRRSFFWSGVMAAFAGVLVAPLLFMSVTLSIGLLLKGFIAACVGGLGNSRGALAGGYVVGALEAVSARYGSPLLQLTTLLVALLAILMFRPAGIFGRVVMRRV